MNVGTYLCLDVLRKIITSIADNWQFRSVQYKMRKGLRFVLRKKGGYYICGGFKKTVTTMDKIQVDKIRSMNRIVVGPYS